MVVISFDTKAEMAKVESQGYPIFEGNYWDFDVTQLPDLLAKLGLHINVKEYSNGN